MKNLIFIIGTGFKKRDEERFFIQEYLKSGVNVYVFDATPMIESSRFVIDKEIIHCDYYFVFDKFSVLKDRLLEYQRNSVIVLPSNSYQFNSKRIICFLKRNHFFTVKFSLGQLPTSLKNNKNFFTKLKKITFRKLKYKFLDLLTEISLCNTKNVETLLLTTSVNSAMHSRYLQLNSLDYDKFLSFESSNNLENLGDYVVFLDEFLPYHPDNEIQLGVNLQSISKKYYDTLNLFFQSIKEKYGWNIVIASHPRADYRANKKNFINCEVISGHTLELVKNSKLVVAHQSTSISFAVLYNKPIVFVTMDEIKNTIGLQIGIFSNYLQSQLVDLSQASNNMQLKLDIDNKCYVNCY